MNYVMNCLFKYKKLKHQTLWKNAKVSLKGGYGFITLTSHESYKWILLIVAVNGSIYQTRI